MDQIHHIRQMFYEQGKNISEIATATGLNWKTVKKYVDMEDFSSPPPAPETEVTHDSKLNHFKPLIDSWLGGDRKIAKKTAPYRKKRIYCRLKEETEGFSCSYRLVASHVAGKRRAAIVPAGRVYPADPPSRWSTGRFRHCRFYENGHHYRGKEIPCPQLPIQQWRLPAAQLRRKYRMSSRRTQTMFEYIGGVPDRDLVW